MSNMFCFQCEQTARGQGCTTMGVCGKNPTVAGKQDALTCEMIALAKAALAANAVSSSTTDLLVDGLFTTITNVSFYTEQIAALIERIQAARAALPAQDVPAEQDLFHGDTDIISLRSTLLFGMRGMAAYAHHARVLGKQDDTVNQFFYKGLAGLMEERSVEDWLALLMEFGQVNLTCMALLDAANTGAYGTPVPTQVTTDIEAGPFIVITGHDLHDLMMLLQQSEGKGVNIYTHGEMLPAHAYPELKKFSHLKGNFGTAWQNQQKEFADIPAPILFTTNCLMPPKTSYADRVFTTSVVGYPEMIHVEADENGQKDFTSLIDSALNLGGYAEKQLQSGINGGHTLTTGFGHGTVLGVADQVVDAVKSGAISHFFLVGGCDGAKPGRNYYTKFVEQTPQDSVILTLACGKFRFNDLDLGTIGGLPRIM
ncbi:MAG: hydroxylamine reductase, partial [Christensenellales bacterium]